MAASDIEHLHQLAVHSYYVGEQATGLRACERLLGERLTPERESLVRSNRTWYTQPLSSLADCVQAPLPVEPARPGWTTFNPSICQRSGGGFALVVRSSNYRMVDGRYVTPDEDAGRIRTENTLYKLDTELHRYGQPVPLVAEYDRSEFPVDGLEDCRINCVEGSLSLSATIRNAAGRDGLARIAAVDYTPYEPLRPVVLDEPVAGRHEKNWMPLIGTRAWLYSCHIDGKVVTAHRQGDRWTLIPRGNSPAIARGFRGGSQLLQCDGGWLACVHEVADLGGRRAYEHRFVWFDCQLAIVGWSPPFFFNDRQQIEFAAGLAWKCPGTLACTYGVRDEEAWLATIDYASLRAWRVDA